MSATDFCYFLQGFSELANERPTAKQWETIKLKLNESIEKPYYTQFNSERITGMLVDCHYGLIC